MAQLIDKDALVAEIERTEKILNIDDVGGRSVMVWCEVFKNFIDTLEVKEVDLDYIKNELDKLIKIHKPNEDFGWGTLYNVATHFFELGLKAQKGK